MKSFLDIALDLRLVGMGAERVFLSRRNLLVLISKLDRRARGEETVCTVMKRDDRHPVFPQTMKLIAVTALENEAYYCNREAGWVLEEDDPSSRDRQEHTMSVVGQSVQERKIMVVAYFLNLWEKNPAWRFGQLVANVVDVQSCARLFDIEDDELLQVLSGFDGGGSPASTDETES